MLRIFLCLGLVLHKLVWEVMKRDRRQAPARAAAGGFGFRSLIKMGKSAALAFIVIQTLFLRVWPISKRPTPLKAIGAAIFLGGLLLAVAGRLKLADNWADLEDFQILSEQELVREGIYGVIRHPIYTGDVLLILGLELALNSWLVLSVLGLIPLVVRQALAEETLLLQSFPGYGAYRQRTRMFIPKLF